MQYVRITLAPDKLNGEVRLPASKSISNRALIIQALCEQEFPLINVSTADDTQLLRRALASDEKVMYIKNAGTAMRFLTAYFAATEGDVVLRGSERMHERPIKPLVDALVSLGADIEYLEKPGYPPLLILGKELSGGSVKVDPSTSSQFITALLLIAPVLKGGLTIEVTGEIVSGPYLEMTLNMMNYFGVEYSRERNTIHVPQQKYKPKTLFIESDWSSASYIFGLAALFPGSELSFNNLYNESWQGDLKLSGWMAQFGIHITFEQKNCTIRSDGSYSDYFKAGMLDNPDLIPAFVTLCCVANVPFEISGIETLQYKESDRAEVLVNELGKLYNIRRDGNTLSGKGISGSAAQSVKLLSYDDHRMAMSWALAASKFGNVSIENPGAVEKSFPQFWKELERLGFVLECFDE